MIQTVLLHFGQQLEHKPIHSQCKSVQLQQGMYQHKLPSRHALATNMQSKY